MIKILYSESQGSAGETITARKWRFEAMRTYLVTGGAGFIGSNYIHYMFRKYGDQIRIINVDALTYAGNLENLKDVEDKDNYTFVRADICDKEAIKKIFAENDIDRVVHFAAESHVDRSIRNPEIGRAHV